MKPKPNLRARRTGGRPPVDEARALSCRVSCACTPAQRSQIREAASACGLTTSEFLLRAALGRPVRPVLPGHWREAWASLQPLTSSLHQLVRHLNFKAAAGELHDPNVLPDLLALVPPLAQQLRALRAELLPTRGGEE